MDLKKHEIAMAAGRDAGNRAMSRAGRKAWSVDDWNEAAKVYWDVYPLEEELKTSGGQDDKSIS